MKKISQVHFLLVVLFTLCIPSPTRADDSVEILNEDIEYIFAEEIIFQIQFQSEITINQVNLIIQASSTPAFIGQAVLISPDTAQFVYDLKHRPLPAFSNVTYSFQLNLENGEVFETPEYSFTYLDNRHNWQELIEEPFKIHWYEGEITLAHEVLDAARKGLDQILELLQQPKNNQVIEIFIYSTEEELQSTLTSIGQTWVGGHADPRIGSVVVSLPPGVDQSLEIQRLIPHEITHIILYRFMGVEYEYLPIWVSEGISSQMEAYSHPDYPLILEKAERENGLIPIAYLCQAFPVDPELALLSYAQSDSLLEYIQREYGVTGIQALIHAYDQGVSCERGVEVALGLSLGSLEKDWKLDVFSGGRYLTYIYILSGVLLILLIILGVFIFSKLRADPAQSGWDENE
jgi:hypothetical protein